ncbi:hypothetical protein SS50377_21886 [Spironucleus salmonicida]|uniref:Uncharacterized protein n=1 Tax=Spironucleus salmonicida TaxID=348837 RepID=V6LJ96_9EUKA|nr:hypothetical protein SS50377_21886 [Spironucleus salmonicida]|eukprot:EST44428.1 Hypothetical protein SS50377_15734 [Spironucleus salmonicida]
MGCGYISSFEEEVMLVNKGIHIRHIQQGSKDVPFIVIGQQQGNQEDDQERSQQLQQKNGDDKVQLYLDHQLTQQVVWTDFDTKHEERSDSYDPNLTNQNQVGLGRINTIQE